MNVNFCGKCGKKMIEGNKFCMSCGWEVESLFRAELNGHISSVNSQSNHQPQVESSQLTDRPTRKKTRLGIIIAGVSGVLILTASLIFVAVMNKTEIMDKPIVADGIYYVDAGKGSRGYRIDLDGNNKVQFIDDYINNIAVDNGWVYYTSLTGVYKVMEDGTGTVKINDSWSNEIAVADGWVYFIAVDSHDAAIETLYRVTTDGDYAEEISTDSVSDIMVENQWLYYRNEDDDCRIYRVALDGSSKEKLTTDGADYYDIEEGYLYYSDNNHFYSLCQLGLESGAKRILYEHVSTDIQLSEGLIYFVNGSDDAIYKMKTNGTAMEKISSDDTEKLTVEGDWIYYIKAATGLMGESLYKIKTDGSMRTRLK